MKECLSIRQFEWEAGYCDDGGQLIQKMQVRCRAGLLSVGLVSSDLLAILLCLVLFLAV